LSAVLTLLSLLPFLLLIYLANVSERSQDARPILYLSLAVINGLILAAGVFAIVAAALLTDETLSGAAQTPIAVQQLRAARLDLGGLALVIGALLALAALLPPVRRLAARLLPMQADSPVHVTALSLTATALGLNLFQMLALTPALFALVEDPQQRQQLSSPSYLDVLAFPLLAFTLAALLGVGLGVRRSHAEVLARLGVKPLTLPHLGLALISTAALIGLAIATEQLWRMLDPQGLERVGSLSKALLGNFSGFSGALAIGTAAAIGEETFFRGAYQPRMGIVITSLLFASFHVQYGITPATLLILAMSLILGVLRARTSLSVCVLVHFLYNFTTVLLTS
jgi:uncharacterized protein